VQNSRLHLNFKNCICLKAVFAVTYNVAFFTVPRLAELRDRSLCHSVIYSFVLSMSRITHERDDGRRPNMVGMGKG